MIGAYGSYGSMALPQYLTNPYLNPTPFPPQMINGGGYFPGISGFTPYSPAWGGGQPAFGTPFAKPTPSYPINANPYLTPPFPQPRPATNPWPFLPTQRQAPQPAQPTPSNRWLTQPAAKTLGPQPGYPILPWPFVMLPQAQSPAQTAPEPQIAAPMPWPFGMPKQPDASAHTGGTLVAPLQTDGFRPRPAPTQTPAQEQPSQPAPAVQNPFPAFGWPWMPQPAPTE
jgi:hypothetical protein